MRNAVRKAGITSRRRL
ncbi:hypothetical protein ACOREW_004753 [Escherichia coli]